MVIISKKIEMLMKSFFLHLNFVKSCWFFVVRNLVGIIRSAFGRMARTSAPFIYLIDLKLSILLQNTLFLRFTWLKYYFHFFTVVCETSAEIYCSPFVCTLYNEQRLPMSQCIMSWHDAFYAVTTRIRFKS